MPPVFRNLSDADKERVPLIVNHPLDHSDKIEVLHGRTQEEVTAELGEPNQMTEFSIEGGVAGEFRCELLNTYPLGNPRSKGVRIREWIWKYREFSVAVWFHKSEGRWVALDTCRWKKGVVF